MDFVSLVDMDPVGYKTFSWIRNFASDPDPYHGQNRAGQHVIPL